MEKSGKKNNEQANLAYSMTVHSNFVDENVMRKVGPEFDCLWFCASSKFEWCGIEEVGSGSFSYIKKDTKSKCRIFLLKNDFPSFLSSSYVRTTNIY
jgi:hypothetical protein